MSTTTHAFICDDFRRVVKSTLRGFATVTLPSGMIISDISVHRKGESHWASPPSKPMLDRDGRQIIKDAKGLWSPIISFASKELRDKFSHAVVEAVLVAHPEALDDAAA